MIWRHLYDFTRDDLCFLVEGFTPAGGTPLTPELVLCIRMCPDKCLKEGLKYLKNK